MMLMVQLCPQTRDKTYCLFALRVDPELSAVNQIFLWNTAQRLHHIDFDAH